MSHHTAGVEVREHFTLTPSEAEAWLAAQRLAGGSAVLLCTCNRCEVYWSGDHDLGRWFQDFARARGAERHQAVTRLDGAAAVRHLYTVTAGLDSHQFHFKAWMRGPQCRGHLAALYPGKGGAARPETQLSGHIHGVN